MVLPDVQSYDRRFTSNNFNYSLLVAPSFANGGNLFILPMCVCMCVCVYIYKLVYIYKHTYINLKQTKYNKNKNFIFLN